MSKREYEGNVRGLLGRWRGPRQLHPPSIDTSVEAPEKPNEAEIVKLRQRIEELEDAGRDALKVLAHISAMNSDYTAADFAIEKLRNAGVTLEEYHERT